MMNAVPKDGGCQHTDGWVGQTSLVRQWEEMKKEILLHKWYESEKAGYDIGWERAVVDWMIRYGNRSTRS